MGGWVKLGVGDTDCQVVVCWERERKIEEERLAQAWDILCSCPAHCPRLFMDINGGIGKSVMSYAPDTAGLVKARPRVNLATECKWPNCDTLLTLWGNNAMSKSIMFSHVYCAYALSAKVPFETGMSLSYWDNVVLLICPYVILEGHFSRSIAPPPPPVPLFHASSFLS